MPSKSDDDWSNWVSALITNVAPSESNQAEGDQALSHAKQLLNAIDSGGIPTDPIRINRIGRALGLEVHASASMEETVTRIRLMLAKT